MSFPSINIYTLKQIRTMHRRYDLEDYPITIPQICYQILQYILDLKSEPVEKFGIISLNSRNKIIGIHRDLENPASLGQVPLINFTSNPATSLWPP
jgi:hypothetical protein